MTTDLHTEINARHLPRVLRDIVKLIGLPATMKIVQHYGGVRLWVPKTMTEEHELARLLGFAPAEKLARAYGGDEHFDVPLALKALRAVRDGRIRAEARRCSTRTLARRYKLTERRIWHILAAVVDERQGGLF